MFAVIFIPDFALQAVLRHEPQLASRPIGLIDAHETTAPSVQMTRSAREAGVVEGLTPTQALARCGDILIKTRSIAQEQTATEALLQTAYAFSPRIESTANGVCTMDLQGLPISNAAAKVNEPGKETPLQSWAQKILISLAQLNLRGQIGIAFTPNVALHAARCAQPLLVIENSTDFISHLPVESLDPIPAVLTILRRWGIKTVGQFTALKKDKIAERLGPEGMELFERADMKHVRPLDLATPAEIFSESMDFEVEIESLQPLLFVLNRFLEQLTRRLTLSHFAAQELQLRLKLSSGDKYEHTFAVPSPTANTAILLRMLQTHLETVRTESGIVALEFSIKPTRTEAFQFGLFETALRDPNHFSETLARLSALCGNENVGTPVVLDTFRPDAFKMERPRFDSVAEQKNLLEPVGLNLRRFRPAFHADVELAHGDPIFLSSLRINTPIENFVGPYRSSGDWWEQEKVWNRDEWDVVTRDGTVYRIFREKEDWFVEGIYD